MIGRMGLLGGLAALAMASAAIAQSRDGAAGASHAPPIAFQVTEEGQHVAFDRYTWERRELAKRLPLTEPFPDEAVMGPYLKRFGLDVNPLVPGPIPVPRMIVPGLYLVQSFPTNSFLIDGGAAGLALIDPGVMPTAEATAANIRAAGFDPARIHWIIDTHAHFDHSEANAFFAGRNTRICAGREDAGAIRAGGELTAGNMKRFYQLPPKQLPLTDEWRSTIYKSAVNCELDDGDAIEVGPYRLRISHVPGHTPGSIAISTRMDGRWILFGGDSILFEGRLGAQMLPHSDNVAYVASLAKMQQLRDDDGDLILWDMLMPAHGTLSLDRGYKDVEEAWETARLTLDQGKAIAALPFASERFRYRMFGRPLLEAPPR